MAEHGLQLYPPPRSVRLRKGTLLRGTRRLIVVHGALSRRLQTAMSGRLQNAVVAFAETQDLVITHGDPDSAAILVQLNPVKGIAAEGYNLTVASSGIEINASDDAGFFYGLQTLSQILDQCGNPVPFMTVQDAPDFAHRGVMLDISRCKVPTLATLFELIDRFAQLKLNQLQLYTEHTFAFVNHPLVWANASPLSAADIIALKEYCDACFIELVPNLNSFGHFERWLRHPEYHEYAECPHGFEHPFSGQQIPFGSTLYPDRKSLALLEELYDEYLPLFDSRFFNVGGDEPWELGQGRSKARCDKAGATHVYIDFISKIKRQVKARDRTMMFWSDIVLREPESLSKLSRDMVALNWGYEADHPFMKECRQMQGAKIPYYVCPGTSSWNSLTGRIANAEKNLANAASAGLANGASGYLVTDWGDHGHHQYLPISYPGFLMGACHAWNHKGSKRLDFIDGVSYMFFDDGSRESGEILWALGKVLELAPAPIRNATLFNRLMFWDMTHEPGAVKNITAAQLKSCEAALLEVRSGLGDMQPGQDGDLVRAEIDNAIRLALHSIHRLQYFRGQLKNASPLRQELSVAIGEHERLWLARNQPGGLRESSSHLHRSLDALS